MKLKSFSLEKQQKDNFLLTKFKCCHSADKLKVSVLIDL
ncbi:MAG: hypothetical protein OFPI_22440 [Osedax symbiont Rs2]|nr:MAG: hypothetical protein OFPI_22440 [Osedax symbiont Rs2]